MGSGTVNSDAFGGAGGGALHLDSIPVVDLRLFSQSELYSLSLCSSSAFDPRRCEEVVIPKIDRSVFNESAGSRKQTYSRLRLAPPPSTSAESGRRDPQLSLSTTSVGVTRDSESDTEIEESIQIVNLLKQLFVADMNLAKLVTVEGHKSDAKCRNRFLPPPLLSPSEYEAAGNKRKRGRPCLTDKSNVKQEISGDGDLDRKVGLPSMFEIIVRENMEEKDRGTLNAERVAVDLVALGNVRHPYAGEISRRTQGLRTKEEFVGFLEGLCGQWRSRRKRKKIVDASTFGSAMPVGWKVLLAIKNKDGQIKLCCSRYISPSGLYFVTCRGVSSYLCSLHGIQCTHAAHYVQRNKMVDNADNLVSKSIVDASVQVNYQDVKLDSKLLLSDDKEIEVEVNSLDVELHRVGENIYCSSCDVTFSCEEDLIRHYAVDHKRKRYKNGVRESGEMINLSSQEKTVGDSLANGDILVQDPVSGMAMKSDSISAVDSNQPPINSPCYQQDDHAVALTDASRNMRYDDEDDHGGNEINRSSVTAALHAMRMNLFEYESRSCSAGEMVEHEKISLNRSPEPSDDGNSGPLENPEQHTASQNRPLYSMDDVEECGTEYQQTYENNAVNDCQNKGPTVSTVHQKVYEMGRLNSSVEGTNEVDKLHFGDASTVFPSNEHKNMPRMDESAAVISQPEQCEKRFNSESRLEAISDDQNMYDSEYGNIEVCGRHARTAESDDLEYTGNGQPNDHFESCHGVLRSTPAPRTDHNRKFEVCSSFEPDKIFTEENLSIFNEPLEGHKEQSEELLFGLNASSGISDGASVFHTTYANPSLHGQRREVENTRIPDSSLSFGDLQTPAHRTYINQASSSVMEGSIPGDLKLGMSYAFDFNHPSFSTRRDQSVTNFEISQPQGNWNGPRGDKLGTYGQNLIAGVENSSSQFGEQMNTTNVSWKNRLENNPQVCFPPTSAHQISSPNHFHNFGFTMDQGARNEFAVRRTASPGEMTRLGNSEPVEYSFMGEHTSNLLPRETPNMLSYNAKNKETSSPPFWLGKDALMPNTTTRTNMELAASVCMWCRDVFFHEQASHPGGMQGGGSVCPSCRSRFPGQFNLL